MSKSKRSIFNSISAAMLNIINGVLGFIVTYLVIKNFGSDFNGVNATANQIVTVLLLLEGGFTLATNVALIKPYQENNNKAINAIICATKKRFQQIGIIFFVLGLIISIVYSNIVVSGIHNLIIFVIMIMAIIPSAFSLFYATKYRILIQAEQKEYIISIVAMCTISVGHIINIIIINLGCHMLATRLVTMVCAIIQSIVLGAYCKRRFRDIDFKEEPDFSLIVGTKDVLVQKITAVVYRTLPIITISLVSTAGTVVASVYGVYNSIYQLIKSMLQAFMDGPRLSLGQVICEKEKEYVYKKFILYELITVMALCIFLGTTVVMIVPFVTWYSKGFDNDNYVNYTFAICMALINFIEILHIPSGNYINMSGNFKKSKVIQVNSLIILILTSIFGILMVGFYGAIYAVLATAIYLAFCEIYYVHVKVFGKLKDFFKIIGVNIVAIFAVILVFSKVLPLKITIAKLFLYAILVFSVNVIVILGINYIFNKSFFKDIIAMLKTVINKKIADS